MNKYNVLWFDVSMYYFVFMHVAETFEDFSGENGD